MKRKGGQAVDELTKMIGESLTIMENREYEILMRAYRSKITDDDLIDVLDEASDRFSRYLESINFERYPMIEKGINKFFQLDVRTNKTRAFDVMKRIDRLILGAIDQDEIAGEAKKSKH